MDRSSTWIQQDLGEKMTHVKFGFWGWGLSGPECHCILPPSFPLNLALKKDLFIFQLEMNISSHEPSWRKTKDKTSIWPVWATHPQPR